MKKPVIDYRQLRLWNLTSPRYAHLLLLSGWIVYFALYFLTENLIPAEACYPIHSTVDDWIPFCEWFLIPYFGWYGLIVFSLGYFLLYDVKDFKRLQIYIMVTQAAAMACYIFFPTRQDLRPVVFANDNLLTKGVQMLYRFDTNTGVCPSLHVAYSLGIASVWVKRKESRPVTKALIVVAVVLICLSTMFIKQHSFVDVVAAGFGKGEAMQRLSELLEIPFDRFFSAGDAITDLPMLRASGISFAPENALEEVKQAVTHVVPSVYCGGMEKAFSIAADHIRINQKSRYGG